MLNCLAGDTVEWPLGVASRLSTRDDHVAAAAERRVTSGSILFVCRCRWRSLSTLDDTRLGGVTNTTKAHAKCVLMPALQSVALAVETQHATHAVSEDKADTEAEGLDVISTERVWLHVPECLPRECCHCCDTPLRRMCPPPHYPQVCATVPHP